MDKTFIERIGASKEIIEELGKFSLLWAQFELEYCENNCSDKLFLNDTEFNKFLQNVSSQTNKNKYILLRENFLKLCNFNLDFNHLIKNLISVLLKYLHKTKETITPEFIHEKLYSNNFTSYYTQVDNIICNNINDNTESLLGGLLIIFRLRNNLFHGLKDCYTIDNQIEIFKSCNCILDFLLNH